MNSMSNTFWNTALAFTADSRRIPDAKGAVYLLGLTVLGMLGNHLNVEMFFGVNFIFGSIATMVAVRASGTLWGTLVGIAIGSYTYFLWGHPYAIYIFGLEAFVVGFIVCALKKDNMVLADVGFWLVIGMPLVWVFYTYQLDLPETPVKLIALKQTINGIVNTFAATLLMQFFPLSLLGVGFRKGSTERNLSIKAAMNNIIAAFFLLPMLVSITLFGNDELKQIKANLQSQVSEEVKDTGREFSSVLHSYSSVLKSLVVVEFSKDRRQAWATIVDKWTDGIIPGLLNVEITSAEGEILFSHPMPRSGQSEYAEQVKAATHNLINLSDYHGDSAVRESHFTKIVPMGNKQYLVASFSNEIFAFQLRRIAHDNQLIELLDGAGNVVASSGEMDLREYVQGDDPHQLMPANENLPTMVRWRKAYWEDTAPLMEGNAWIVRVAVPMADAIDMLQEDYIKKMATTLVIAFISLLLTPLVTRSISTPLSELTKVASMYTETTGRSDVEWPSSTILEVNMLVEQFQIFVRTINEKQSLLSTFFDNTPSSVTVKGLDGEFLMVNQLWRDWFHPKNVDVEKLKPEDIFDADHRKEVLELEKLVIETGQVQEREMQTPLANGETLTTLMQKFPIYDSKKELISIGGINTDITEIKHSQAQVIQASKLATLGEMATSVAHELNQPLNVIRMAAGNSRRKLANGGFDPEYLDKKLERIESQTARAAAIIDHMRMFGRKAHEDAEPINLRKAVNNALNLMGEQLRLARIEVVREFPEECASVWGHIIQMEQVILNIISNAQQAMETCDGNKRIAFKIVEENNNLILTIVDTGGGIPEEIMARIFEPFYTTKEMGEGTGLGLSVSYGIIRDMGGTIEAENVDAGAKFTITLPAVANG